MPTDPYRTSDYLKTPEDIAEYLNAAIEEMDEDPRMLLIALRNVAEAMGGVSELARRTDLNRPGLSRVLSGQNTPKIDTFFKIIEACGVRVQFST